MIRKTKKYSWPKKLYDSARIKDENLLVEKFGLKNKREIWKAEAKVKYLRQRAKDLITASEEDKNAFFDKLNKRGLKVSAIADVLALTKEDILNRRLATVVYRKNLARTPKQARQMVVHRKVKINERVVNVPGYLVKVDEEDLIRAQEVKMPIKKQEEEQDE